jgi:hypothetical protein
LEGLDARGVKGLSVQNNASNTALERHRSDSLDREAQGSLLRMAANEGEGFSIQLVILGHMVKDVRSAAIDGDEPRKRE